MIDLALAKIDKLDIDRPYLSKSYSVDMLQIEEAEKIIGGSFPPSYKDFLLSLGSGDFCGIEFYGLVPNRNDLQEIPNVIWTSKSLHDCGELHKDFLAVESLGDGIYACISIGSNDEDSPVYEHDIANGTCSLDDEMLSKSFAEYFYNRITEALEELSL